MALFHLPLRTAFRALLETGLPLWNPWLQGGQPVLSNPNYSAFYPPTWLGLLLPPAYALSLLVLLHAALAGAGAWRWARRLGCEPPAAALAALSFSGGGALLSSISALTIFFGMAWFPWVLAWGDSAWKEEPRAGWLRAAALAGLALGLQLLNGEPVSVMIGGLGLLALALPAVIRRPAALLRLPLPFLLALALAAVQLIPTAGRLADSPRAGGLGAETATLWSSPPARLIELVFPRFFGDPSRDAENLYFGWHVHDRDFPYLLSLYPGLLLTVLGLLALLRRSTPRWGVWVGIVGTGLLLALGRHNPLFTALREHLWFLALQRYPEKLALLAVAGLSFAGALAWQRLIAEREAGRRDAFDLPLALSLVVLATSLSLFGLLRGRPELGLWMVRTHGNPAMGAADWERGAAYLGTEALWAVATAAAVALLLALGRSRRLSSPRLSALAVLLVAADLWHYNRGLVATLPTAWYRNPPAAARELQARPERIYVRADPSERLDFVPRFSEDTEARLALVRTQLDRLEPYSGLVWGLASVFDDDFDLMSTLWARRAAELLQVEAPRPDLSRRLLGAWNVGTVVLRRPPEEWLAPGSGGPLGPVRLEPNPYVLPRWRFVPRASFHTSLPSAIGGARADYYALHRGEHCLREGIPAETVTYRSPPEVLDFAESPSRFTVRYRCASPAFFAWAVTFDAGWQARVDGQVVSAYPTAIGQIGVPLPAGEHELVLAYRQRGLAAGAAVSLAGLLALGFLLFVARPGGQRRSGA